MSYYHCIYIAQFIHSLLIQVSISKLHFKHTLSGTVEMHVLEMHIKRTTTLCYIFLVHLFLYRGFPFASLNTSAMPSKLNFTLTWSTRQVVHVLSIKIHIFHL